MELATKLEILADAAKYDASCASSGSAFARPQPGGIGNSTGIGICHSYTPDGRCVSLLKILLTNYCIYDCSLLRQSHLQRHPARPLHAGGSRRLTLDFYRRNYIEGLFLSSGIIQIARLHHGATRRASPKPCATDHSFNGYIHLKAIPGASQRAHSTKPAAGPTASAPTSNFPRRPTSVKLAPEKNLVTSVDMTGIETHDEATDAARIAEKAYRLLAKITRKAAPRRQLRSRRSKHPNGRRRHAQHRRALSHHAPPTFTANINCDAFTTPPSALSQKPIHAFPSPPPPWCASIASTKPTGSCASTGSKPRELTTPSSTQSRSPPRSQIAVGPAQSRPLSRRHQPRAARRSLAHPRHRLSQRRSDSLHSPLPSFANRRLAETPYFPEARQRFPHRRRSQSASRSRPGRGFIRTNRHDRPAAPTFPV